MRIDNPKTTTAGLGVGVLTLLNLFGVDIPQEAITGLLGGALALIGLFSKDNNK